MSNNRKIARRVLVAKEPDRDESCVDVAERIALSFNATLSQLEVASGDPATAIIERIEEDDIDLVVVGTHERQGFDRWRSVGMAVVHAAECSVLVSRSSSPTRGPVLVACDLGRGTGAVLESAGAFAQQLAEPLVALHAVEPNRHDISLIANAIVSGMVTPAPAASSVEAYLQVADGALHAELAAAGVDARPEIASGRAAERILERARELRASLIVVGTHDRGALGRFVLGSVGDTVVRDAHCSVLVVRPALATLDSQRALRTRDSLSAVATEAVEGAFGGLAGAVAGAMAGPIGAATGAALGAAAAVALGRQTESDQHLAALHLRELDGATIPSRQSGRR